MGKKKGSRFERKIARELSLWLTDGSDDTQLIRSKQSGGWSRKKGNQFGDLAPNGSRGQLLRSVFVIECKAREDFKFQHIWSSLEPGLYAWWNQVVSESSEVDAVPMLVYSKNYAPNLVGFPPSFVEILFPEARTMTVFWPDLDIPPITLLEFDQLKVIDPDYFIKRGQEYLDS